MKEHESKPKKEPRGVRLAREHVQLHEVIGADGLQDRLMTFNWYAGVNPNSEEFMEAAQRFVKEANRMLNPDLNEGEDYCK